MDRHARRTRRPQIYGGGFVLAALGAALVLFPPAALTRLDWDVYDTLLRAAGTRPPLGRIVIVDIDDRSVAEVGQWPWRRDVIARLIGRLRDGRARTIALNIIFAEPDRAEAGPGTPGQQSDGRLAEAVKDAHVVLGYAFTFASAASGSPRCVLHPLRLTVVQPAGEAGDGPLFRATDALCSLPAFAEAAGASGFLNAAPDPDGILRRVPLVLSFDDRVYPALALAAVGAPAGELRAINPTTSSLTAGDLTVPLDGRGNLSIHYRGGRRTFPYVSAADVLDGRAPAATFEDKIVFVGATALGIQENVATPYDALFPGVEVQATVADNLLRGDFIRRPEHTQLLQLLLVAGVCLGTAVLMGHAGVRWGIAAASAGVAALWGAAYWLRASSGVYLSPVLPSGALAASVVALSAIALASDVRVALAALHRARRAAESADRAKNEFLMTVSHELRTPLSIIYGYAQMLGKGGLRDEQKIRALASVERNARAQTQLIDDLLVASKSATGKLRLDVDGVELAGVVRSVVETMRPAIDAKRLRLTTALADDAGVVLGDRDRLQQVVWNLLSNAIKFTPERGAVDVRLERVNASVQVTVSDTGKGISPEFLPHVFEQFQQQDSAVTRQYGGLGLGLALTRYLVELHGGSIEAESQGEGRGATFRLRLPLTDAPAAAPPAAIGTGSPRLGPLRVLVVDDAAEMRAAAAAALLDAGARVVTAASAQDARALLHDGFQDVLAVSLDLPNEEGYALVHDASSLAAMQHRRLRIVALGGSPSSERMAELTQQGVVRHLPTPVDPDALVAQMRALS